jgi:hypothetical protein
MLKVIKAMWKMLGISERQEIWNIPIRKGIDFPKLG